MAAIDNLRVLVQDNGTTQRFTDDDLTVFSTIAVDDVNAYAKTAFTFSQWNTLDETIPLYQRQLIYAASRLYAIEADIANPRRYIKLVTQDSQYDATEVTKQLNRLKWNIQQDYESKLKKWLGMDAGMMVGVSQFFEPTVIEEI